MASAAVQNKTPRKVLKKIDPAIPLIAYSFIAPNFIGFCVFTLVPMVFAIALAFCAWDGRHAIEFIGLKNFCKTLYQPIKFFSGGAEKYHRLRHWHGAADAGLLAGHGCAAEPELKLRNFFRAVAFFPYVASLVAVAAVWNMIFNPSMGPINMILNQFFGVAVENLPRWAAGKDTAMITVILFSVWKNMGYYMVIYLAGLQGCNPDLNEAAELDGANRWQQFWHITLPQLRPTTFFVVIMLTISGFKVYDQMYMITQGGPGTATMTLVYYIYNVAFVNTPKYGYASAIAMVLFVLVLIVTIIQFRGSKGDN